MLCIGIEADAAGIDILAYCIKVLHTHCTSILLEAEMDTPCTSTLQAMDPCSSILLAVERVYTLHVHTAGGVEG